VAHQSECHTTEHRDLFLGGYAHLRGRVCRRRAAAAGTFCAMLAHVSRAAVSRRKMDWIQHVRPIIDGAFGNKVDTLRSQRAGASSCPDHLLEEEPGGVG
jgi:hypothetical protein